MRNQEYIAGMRPDDAYKVLDWVMHDYGKRFINTPFAVINWLQTETVCGEWRKLSGCVTAGGDPVYVCPRCGQDEHVYGIEHPECRKAFCSVCGCFNMYPYGGAENDTEDQGADVEGDL